MTAYPIGKAQVKRQGKGVAILAFGSMVAAAEKAGEALDATVVNMRFVKPLDTELLRELARTHEGFVTVEEHVIMGGAGAACLEAFSALQIKADVLLLGLPDRFIDHGEHQQLLAAEGLDAKGIEASVRARFADLIKVAGPRLVSNQG
jgi:1-deoxy-D-xylulose-5-phosphate synthase